jgi:hypothetical protein
MNEFGTAPCIPLSDTPGFFRYSDEKGGMATFYIYDEDGDAVPVFSAAREITPELREKPQHKDPDCKCEWTDQTYRCGCEGHHEGELVDVLPRLEVCNTKECDGTHASLLALCEECFCADVAAGKAPKDATGDAIRILML